MLSRERSRVPPMPGLKRGDLAGLRPPRVHPMSTRMRCACAIAAHEAHKLRCTVRQHLEVAQRQSDCMKVLPSCLRGLEAWTSSGYHRKSNHIAHLSRLVVQVESVAWDGCTPRCWLLPGTRRVRAYRMSEPVSRSSATSSNMPHAVPKYRIEDCVPYVTRGVGEWSACYTQRELAVSPQSNCRCSARASAIIFSFDESCIKIV